MSDWPVGWDPDEYGDCPEIDMDDAIIYRIGLFNIGWAHMESKFDVLFCILFKLDPTYSNSIYAGLGMKAKISILRSATDQISELLGEKIHDQLIAIYDYVGFMAVEWRNNLAHAGYQGGNTFVRVTNHQKLKGKFLEPTPESLDEAIFDIRETTEELHDIARVLIPVMKNITAADFDRVCYYRP